MPRDIFISNSTSLDVNNDQIRGFKPALPHQHASLPQQHGTAVTTASARSIQTHLACFPGELGWKASANFWAALAPSHYRGMQPFPSTANNPLFAFRAITAGPGEESIIVYSFTTSQLSHIAANVFIDRMANGIHSRDQLGTSATRARLFLLNFLVCFVGKVLYLIFFRILTNTYVRAGQAYQLFSILVSSTNQN